MSTSGRASAAFLRNRLAASNRRNRAPSDGDAGGSGSSGISSRSSGISWLSSGAPAPSCARRPPGSSSRAYARSDWTQGQ